MKLEDVIYKHGSLDAAIDAYLEHGLDEEEEVCFDVQGSEIDTAIQRRIYERLSSQIAGVGSLTTSVLNRVKRPKSEGVATRCPEGTPSAPGRHETAET